jgi:hypothetical protein
VVFRGAPPQMNAANQLFNNQKWEEAAKAYEVISPLSQTTRARGLSWAIRNQGAVEKPRSQHFKSERRFRGATQVQPSCLILQSGKNPTCSLRRFEWELLQFIFGFSSRIIVKRKFRN